MPSHKLVIDSLVEDNYHLIAIHCPVEDYRMAFLLNKNLNIRLVRTNFDLDFKQKSIKSVYVLFKFYDEESMTCFYLVKNKFESSIENQEKGGSLFQDESQNITTYLLPEFKKVDFFLKIEDCTVPEEIERLLDNIKQIPQLTTAYTVDPNKIKYQENLIFE